MRGDDATNGGVDGIRLCGIYPVMRGGGGVAGLENSGELLCSSKSSYRFSVDILLLSLVAAICSCCITLFDVSNIFMSSSGFSSSSCSASCICFHISYDDSAADGAGGGGGGGGVVCGCGAIGGDGACSSFIIERILLPATCSIVSKSSADFSALLIFDFCTASTRVAGGGSFELRGSI